MSFLPKSLKKILACIFSEGCARNTLHSLKALLTSAEEPLGQEEPEGKNSPNTVTPTPAYIIQRSVIHPGREQLRKQCGSTDIWHQGISQKTEVHILMETSLTLLLFEYLPLTKIKQVLMSLQREGQERYQYC